MPAESLVPRYRSHSGPFRRGSRDVLRRNDLSSAGRREKTFSSRYSEMPLPETWSGYSQHSEDTLPLPTKHLTAAQVLKFRDEAFHTYFTDPRYLNMVEQKFGPETVNHVRDMTRVKLQRKLVPASKEMAA